MQSQRAPIVVVALNESVIGVDAFTGAHVWERQIKNQALAPRLATWGDCVFVLTKGVQCFRIATGEPIWQGPPDYGDTLLVAHGVVLVGTVDGKVTAYAAADGRLLWHDGLKGKGSAQTAFAMEGGPAAQIDRHR
jgi:outer membrane protein assembly factor BamB